MINASVDAELTFKDTFAAFNALEDDPGDAESTLS